jgi:NAD(P)-dependent dehydrogenase (short-subunit alcohol dehydrogenase family)
MAEQKAVWLITGCDTGMGHAVAETVLEAGHTVFVTARDTANVADLAKRFPQTARVHRLDVTDAAQVREVAEAAERAGGVDVLLNNAGYGILGAAEETAPDEYRPLFEVNFFGMAEVTRALLPGMRKRRRGHIFCTSSSGGYAASPGFAFYAASKFALEGFCDALAQEVAALGIRVTIVEPGSTRTQFAGASMKRPRQQIDDYKETAVTLTTSRMAARDGTQPGDPRKLAAALMKLSVDPKPPLRIPLGDDSIDRVLKKARDQVAEFERWDALSRSIAFDA